MADHHDLHAHESPNDEYLPSPDATYERTDAHVAPIAKFMAWLAGLTILTAIGIAVMFATMVGNRAVEGEQPYPLMAPNVGTVPAPAGPRLQTTPAADMQRFRNSEDARLDTYGWIDEDAGTVRLPIEDAMEMVLERGLPVAEVDDDPSLLPSDSSSGRRNEIRRQ